jgi:hypothetical protein
MCGGAPTIPAARTMIVPVKRDLQRDNSLERTMWDAVERSLGGNERRWRLMRPMTEDEARQWAETHSLELRRADDSRRADLSTRKRAYPAPERPPRGDLGETA